MKSNFGKVNVGQLEFKNFYFSWGFYFSAGVLSYKKIVQYFSNENILNFRPLKFLV
ncbi:hypothetical protein ACER0A_006020 [Haloimpatiens sp. FM7315]|uniref:hypothetical protein n=1 Tax=Haloimpatiens sp. FM7315 TaxID=3298609 RepID=UPI00370C241F